MKILQLKKRYAIIIMIMMVAMPALYAQHLNDFFNTRSYKRSHHTTIKNTEHHFNNLIQRNKNPACIEWQTTIGGSGDEDRGAIKSIPGGYITCGSTTSPDGDFHVPANHDYDAYIVRLDIKGNIIWSHTYGGTGYEDFNDILPTSDGGFIAIGATTSDDGDVTGHQGDEDVWVVKCNAEGKIQWQQCYGGIMEDHGNFIVKTSSGYAFCAGAASADGDLKHLFTHGLLDAWIVKISFSGKILFQQTYGGSDDEDANGIYFNASDKTIMFASTALSNNGDIIGNRGGADAWVAKIDVAGNMIWRQTLGGSGDESLNSMVRTTDGNIVFAAFSNSFDRDVAGNNGLFVAWLVKLNATNGHVIWNKTFKDPSELGALGILATADGGTVALGLFGNSSDAQTWDAWVMKTDASGRKEWMKIFGGSKLDFAAFGAETNEGDIITSNYTESNDGDVKKAYGSADSWIVLLDKCGNMVSSKSNELKNMAPGFTNALCIYPNPFSNSTTISFTLSQAQKVAIQIFDINGRLIKNLSYTEMQKGDHHLVWNANDEKGRPLSTGIYFLNIKTADYSETKKLIVVN